MRLNDDDEDDLAFFTTSTAPTKEFITEKGLSLFCRTWPTNNNIFPRALVFISHGFGEHTVPYDSLGRSLSSRGLLAFTHDHYGHGMSEGKRASVDSIDHYVDDLIEHCLKVKEEFKEKEDLPLFIVGHSMGGMIALRAAFRCPDMFRGIVFQGALIIPMSDFLVCLDARVTPLRALVVKTVFSLFDWWDPEMALGGGLSLSAVTSDERVRKKLREDPLRYMGGLKVRLLLAFVSCLQENFAQIPDLRTPFLALHSSEDQLCNVTGARTLHSRARSTDKEIFEYGGAQHNLYIEVPSVREDAVGRTVEWIEKRVVEGEKRKRSNL